MTTIQEFKEHLSKTLDQDFIFCSAEQNPPSERLITAVERRLGFPFPSEFRTFQRAYGGAYLEVFEHVWPRPGVHEAGPWWSFNYACNIFGVGDDIPDDLNIEIANERLQSEASSLLPFPLLPVFEWVIGSGDFTCVNLEGYMFDWWLETPHDPQPVNITFLDFLAKAFSELAYYKALITPNTRTKA